MKIKYKEYYNKQVNVIVKPYNCEYCEKVFNRKDSLKRQL